MGSTTLIHVWIDDFFVTVERQADPALRGRPVVVGGRLGGAGRVVAASVEALACGVVAGMSLREAARRCPDAAFLPGRLERVLDASCALDEAVRRVARRVEWLAVDEAVIDVGPLGRGAATQLADRLRLGVRDVGHTAACGLAASRVAARVAARLARPSGLLCVLPGYEARFLASLDVACLDACDSRSLARLERAGIRTVGELASLPPAAAAAMLGREGPDLTRLAAGLDDRAVAATSAPRRWCRVHRFEPAATSADAVAAIVADLAADLARRLRLSGYDAQSASVRIEDTEERSVSRDAGIATWAAGADVLPTAARGLATALVRSGVPIRAVTVSVSRLSETAPQLSLFPAAHASAGGRARA